MNTQKTKKMCVISHIQLTSSVNILICYEINVHSVKLWAITCEFNKNTFICVEFYDNFLFRKYVCVKKFVSPSDNPSYSGGFCVKDEWTFFLSFVRM